MSTNTYDDAIDAGARGARIAVLLSGASAPPASVDDVADPVVGLLVAEGAEVTLLDSSRRPEALEALERCDGLLVTAVGRRGRDVDPAFYSGEEHPATAFTHPVQDDNDLVVIRRAAQLGLRTLGIGFGMQIGAVARGEPLVAHVEGHVGRGVVSSVIRRLRVSSGLVLEALGDEPVPVACMHHQGLAAELSDGSDLIATAVDEDGMPHAVESRDGAFFGVLWQLGANTEQTAGVLRTFLKRCRNRR